MLKKIFLFFLFFSSLLAFSKDLQNFDANFLKSDEASKQSFHQQLKSLYIKSVIDANKDEKIEILKRLIISSNLLSFSDESYASELLNEGFDEEKIKDIKEALKIFQNDNKEKKVENTEKPVLKTVLAQNIPPPTQKTTKQAEKKPKVKLHVRAFKKLNNGIELRLNRQLDKNELKKFVLKGKGYRYVIDFKAILDIKKQDIKIQKLGISLSQFDPNTVRIVLRSAKEAHFKLVLTSDKLSIFINNPSYITHSQRLSDGINISMNYQINPQVKEYYKNGYFYAELLLPGVLKIKKVVEKYKDAELSMQQFTSSKVRVLIKARKKFEFRKTIGDKKIFVGFKFHKTRPTELRKISKTSTGPTEIIKISKTSTGASLAFKGEIPSMGRQSHTSKGIKYQILNFKAKLKVPKASFKFNNSELNIVQFDTNTARIVLEGKGDLNFDIKDSKIFISISERSSKLNNYQTNIKRKIITIDPGHGGKDSGAIASSHKEKDIVLPVALKLGKELQRRGYRVFYTRTSDKFIELRTRTSMANDNHSDLFISVHANAIAQKKAFEKVHGVETFFLSPARSERSKDAAAKENQSTLEEMNFFSKETFLNFLNREKIIASNKLAIDVQKQVLAQLRKKYKVNDGGVREAPFWVLVGAQMPAILIELGYITNTNERKYLINKTYQENLAIGIAKGVDAYFAKNP